MADNVIETILKLSPDKSALKASIAGAEQLTNVLEATRKRTLSIDDAAVSMNKHLADIARQKAIDQLSSDLANSVKQGGRLNDELLAASHVLSSLGASEDEIKGVARALAEAAEQSERLSNTGGAGGLQSVDRFGRVGTQILSGLGQGEAANAVGLIGDVAGGITDLAPPMLALTAASAVLAIGFGEIQKRMEEARKSAEEYVSAQAEVTGQLVAGATSRELEGQLNTLTRQRDTLLAGGKVLEGFITELQGIFDVGGGVTQEIREDFEQRIRAATGGAVGFEGLTAAIGAYNTQLNNINSQIGVITVSLNSVTVAANDALSAIQQTADHEVDLANLRRTGSSEGVKEQIQTNADLQDALVGANEEIQRQIEANQGNEGALGALYTQLFANHDQINELIAANQELERSVLPIIEAREREAKLAEAITKQYDAQLNTLEQLGNAQEDVNKAQQAYNDALAQSSAKLEQARQAETDAVTKAESAKLEATAKAEAAKLEAIDNAEREAAEARLKALQDFHEAERRINAKYNVDKLTAEGNRDALAAFMAKQQKEEDLQEQERQLSKQEQAVEDTLRKQVEAANRARDKQVAAANEARDKQVAAARDTAQRTIATVTDAGNKELAIRKQTLDAALVQLQNFQNGAIAIMAQLVSSTANMRFGANYGTPTTVTLPNGQTQPGYAVQYGTVNGRYQPIAAPQSGGGATLNLTVNGATQQMVNNASFQQATNVVNGALRQIYGTSAPR